MSTLTETRHAGAFIISEANGMQSREELLVASGQTLDAGEVVMLSAGKLVAWDGATASVVHGIVIYPVDASAAAVKAAFIARNAEVRLSDLTYPAGTTTLVDNLLGSIGIITR